MLGRHTPWRAGSVLLAASFVVLGMLPIVAHATVVGRDATSKSTKSSTSSSAILGQAVLAGTGSITSIPPPAAASAKPMNMSRRVNISGKPAHNSVSAAVMPTTTGRALSGNGTLLQNFDGISDLDNANKTGYILAPPDQGLCVGPLAIAGGEVVIEPVNITFGIYSTSGTELIGPAPLSFLYGEPNFPTEFISDPRCQFDKATGDFFFTILAFNPNTGSESHLDITVLHQNGVFNVYRIDTTDATGRGCPCFADQPLLGIDSQNLYISGNEFPIAQPSPYFNGAEIFAISKSQMAANTTANYVEFPHLSNGGILIETLQPAITNGAAPAEYFLHSFTVDAFGNNSSFDHRLGIFALTNQSAVTAGGTPTLSNPTIFNSETYVQPNLAPEPSGYVLNPDDDRMQQVQYVSGKLYAALSTAVSIKNDATRTGIAWFQIKPSLKGSLTVNASITHQGYVGAAGTYLLYPAIAQGHNGIVEIGFSLSSTTQTPSAAYVVGTATDVTGFGPIFVAATGTGSYYDNFTCNGSAPPGCRWGDYSWATIDPYTDEIWFGAEYIPPLNRQFSDANWGTRIFEVKA
jgi:hypothetical protein